MQSLAPCPSLQSIIRTKTPIPTNRVSPSRLVVQCSTNNSAAAAAANANFCGGVGSTRADWQSACAILASKVVSQQQDTKPTNNTAVNGHKTLDLVPIGTNLPQALTITDLSPAPMHGAKLRVAYQGVPGAYSEAAAGKAYPSCEAIPCDQFEVAFPSRRALDSRSSRFASRELTRRKHPP